MVNLLSVHATAIRCQQEGLPLAEKAIRRFVKEGQIPRIKDGNKTLIYFPNLVRFIQTGNNPSVDAELNDQTDRIGGE